MTNHDFLHKAFMHKVRLTLMQFLHVAVFLGIMALVFHLTFNVAGDYLRKLLLRGIGIASASADHLLELWDAPALLRSLIMEGIFPGVGTVLSFVPVIGLLFFFLSLMEESGYLSYIATLMDKPMRCIGLTGRAVVPLISGFGCNVPAIISAGIMLTGHEKHTVVMMIPFLSCSARLPIYAMFISVFFPDSNAVVLTALYLVSIAAAVFLAALLKLRFPQSRSSRMCRCRKAYPEAACTAISSIHTSSCPSCAASRPPGRAIAAIFRVALLAACENGWAFAKKAFTIILATSVIIWFLQHFDPALHPVADPEYSLLAYLGKSAAPVFAPLGFGDWRAAAALISGIFAKEAVISTLAVITSDISGIGTAVDAIRASAPELSSLLPTIFTPLSAFSFMTFCLLYTPCIATFAATMQILGAKKAVLLAIIQLAVAWTVSFLLFQIGIV